MNLLNLFQKSNNIRIYHECEGRIEKFVPRIIVWHYEAFGVMTNSDPEGRIFYPTLTRIMDSFLAHHKIPHFVLKNRLPEVPEYVEMQHFMMTSL